MKLKLNTVIICVALCLGMTAGQMQLRVYRGTLVHSRVSEQIEVLQDYLLGFDANNLGEVSATACCLVVLRFNLSTVTVLNYVQAYF